MQSKYVLKMGQSGDLIRVLQELLDLNPSGEFDNFTRAAVLAFQKKHGLVSDGIVGPMTWLKLDYNPLELYADTDLVTGASWIKQYNLPEGGKIIDDEGTWLTEVPMNLDYVTTNEFGEQILSNDPTVGIPTKAKYRFKIKKRLHCAFFLPIVSLLGKKW